MTEARRWLEWGLFPCFSWFDAIHKSPRSVHDFLRSGELVHGVMGWAGVFLGFWTLYTLLPLSRTFKDSLTNTQRVEWISRVVSNVNAVVMTLVSAGLVWGERSLFSTSPDGLLLDHEAVYFGSQACLLSYFVYDFMLILVFFRSISSPVSTCVHHLFSSASILLCFRMGNSHPLAIYWASAVTITEASTPLVNARWFLSFRYRDSSLYTVTGLAMLASFVLVRDAYIPYTIFVLLRDARILLKGFDVETAFQLGMIGGGSSFLVWVLNIYWTILMVRGALKILRGTGLRRAATATALNAQHKVD